MELGEGVVVSKSRMVWKTLSGSEGVAVGDGTGGGEGEVGLV